MDNKSTQQLIEERFDELPKVIQKAITDSDWVDELRKIVQENNLLIDQGLAIETETFLMMLGLEHPSNYTKQIKKEANLSREQAIKIATEVEERILSVVKTKIIEETEKEAGIEKNPLDEILEKNSGNESSLPSIDTDLPEDENEERSKLINELEGDITIENDDEDLEEINKQEKEWLEQNVNEEKSSQKVSSNKIPLIENKEKNPRFIETVNNNKKDNLPGLEPIRTLETDSENKDDIITQKLGGATLNKPTTKNNEEVENETVNSQTQPEMNINESINNTTQPQGNNIESQETNTPDVTEQKFEISQNTELESPKNTESEIEKEPEQEKEDSMPPKPTNIDPYREPIE